jgi:hypothetical protein
MKVKGNFVAMLLTAVLTTACQSGAERTMSEPSSAHTAVPATSASPRSHVHGDCSARLAFRGEVYRGQGRGVRKLASRRLSQSAGYLGCGGHKLSAVAYPHSRPWAIQGVPPQDGVYVHDPGVHGLTLYLREDMKYAEKMALAQRVGRR